MTQLNIRRIIFSAYEIYRLRRTTFLQISLLSFLWFSLFYLLIFAIYFSFLSTTFIIAVSLGDKSETYGPQTARDFWSIFLIGSSLFTTFTIFPITKGLRLQAIIGRIASKQLANVREDFPTALQQNKRFWVFFRNQLYILLICIFSTLVTGIITSIVFHKNAKLAVIAFLAVAVFINIYITTKYWMSDIAIALENMTAKNSLQHSAKLSCNHHWQITAIRFCVYLIVLPAYIIPFIPLLLELTTSGIRWLTIRDSVLFILFGLISLMVVQMLVIPFWQSIKAVIYHDLSN